MPVTAPRRFSPVATLAPEPVLTVLPPPAATPAAPAKPGGLRKLSLGAAVAVKKDTKTVYPVLPDANQQAGIIAARILANTESFESLKGALETDKAELKMMTSPHYFTVNHGRHEVPSSIAVNALVDDGQGGLKIDGEVLVCFQNRYPALSDEASLSTILGDRLSEFFRYTTDVKIKGDRLPEATAQELLNEVVAVFTKYNATDALEVKEGVKPTAEFHAARHLAFAPEVNLALEQVAPIVAQIKTKGRK